MFNSGFLYIAKMIKTQAVFMLIYFIGKLLFEHTQLSGIKFAFKDGILNADTVVYTMPCNFAKPFSAFLVLRVYIIGYKYEHSITSIKTADMCQGHRECSVRVKEPGNRGAVPILFLFQGMDVQVHHPCGFATQKEMFFFLAR